MSYILSALRKAENDRRIGEVPDALANEVVEAEQPAARATGASAKILIGIAVLLVVNGALFVWMKSSEPPTGADAAVEAVAPPLQMAPQGAQSPLLPQNVRIPDAVAPRLGGTQRAPAPPEAPQVPREMVEPPASPAQAPASPIIPAETGAALVDYVDLPAATRERLPEMNVSGHVFVPGKPRSSRVIINGRMLRAGQIVEGDLRIEEIHAREIIFELNGGRFRMRTSNLF